MCVGVHEGGFIMFRPIMQKILNIEQFCKRKIQQNLGNLGKILVLFESP
jgi:hypothetical protein